MMKIKKVVITGPESTGKTTLTRDLAKYYHTVYIPEYARTYIERLNRPYCYDDLEHIAKMQVNEIEQYISEARDFIFLDTHLIITKVWFDVVYNRSPQWIMDRIAEKEIDLYLLCSNDLPWISDNVRENGGIMRETLFMKYEEELERFGLNYRIVSGTGNDRLENAVISIDSFFGK